MTVSKRKWNKTAVAINININYKTIVSKCIKHGFKIYPQNIHIAQFWHRLSASWQEGAVSPSMFTLSFFLQKKNKNQALHGHFFSLLSLWEAQVSVGQEASSSPGLRCWRWGRDGCSCAAKTALDERGCSFLPRRTWKLEQ